MDVKARRDVINDIQRHLAKQQYYVQSPSGTYIAVWDGALKNYGPNLGYDYGGRPAPPAPPPWRPPPPRPPPRRAPLTRAARSAGPPAAGLTHRRAGGRQRGVGGHS